MSSGNTVTEQPRRELAADEAVIREQALIRNSVLRRALAIAAYERAKNEGQPDAGIVYMLTWVMQASEELDKEH